MFLLYKHVYKSGRNVSVGIFSNYKAYKKHYPEYVSYDKNQREKEAQKASYLAKHPELVKEEDKKRAIAIINAIDVMDDYSQQKAEDMENTIKGISGGTSYVVGKLGAMIGCILGGFISKGLTWDIKAKNKNYVQSDFTTPKKFIGVTLGTVLGMALGALLPNLYFSSLSARKELEASRKGRLEAFTKDLSSPAQFAVLTEEQEKKVAELSEQVAYKKEEKKHKRRLNWHPFKALKTLLNGDDKEYDKNREKVDNELYLQDVKRRKTPYLTEKQIQDGKRDKELLANIVRKIDMASQDYSENVEFTASAVTTIGGIGGLISAKLIDWIMKKGNVLKGKRELVKLGVGATSFIAGVIISSRLKKNASRVGRFKAKQEILNNPENYIYVDDEKLKEEQNAPVKKKKSMNIFASFAEMYKNAKEYDNYQKENQETIFKQRKAREFIKLTPEQEKEAKNLRINLFKTFDKVDEKSQKYSESVEALGEMASSVLDLIKNSVVLLIPISFLPISEKRNSLFSSVLITVIPALAATLGFDYLVTQEQKKASRVAEMKAIQDLDDYKNYVNYDV